MAITQLAALGFNGLIHHSDRGVQYTSDAYRNIKSFIEDVYNAKRLHSSIGYRPPNEMEAEVLNIR